MGQHVSEVVHPHRLSLCVLSFYSERLKCLGSTITTLTGQRRPLIIPQQSARGKKKRLEQRHVRGSGFFPGVNVKPEEDCWLCARTWRYPKRGMMRGG